MKHRTLEEEINAFIDNWDWKQQVEFLKDIIPLFDLYDVSDEDDWVKEKIGNDEENLRTVRLIRTVYLVSKIAYFHASKMCSINVEFKDLWKKMEKHSIGQEECTESKNKD